MKERIFLWTAFAVIYGSLPLGIGLALYFDNPAWLILTAIAFCVMYAG